MDTGDKNNLLEIYRPGRRKSSILRAFDDELTRLTNEFSINREKIADKIGVSYMYIWRVLSGKSQMRRKVLVKFAARFPSFNLDKWLMYFGYQPERVVDMARRDINVAWAVFEKTFFADRIKERELKAQEVSSEETTSIDPSLQTFTADTE